RPRAASRWRWCASWACPSATSGWGSRSTACSPSRPLRSPRAWSGSEVLEGVVTRGAVTMPDDAAWMNRALALAALGIGETNPNPVVGCVIVKDGRVVGEGWHARAGGPHAEVRALERAGTAARGATMYVTL